MKIHLGLVLCLLAAVSGIGGCAWDRQPMVYEAAVSDEEAPFPEEPQENPSVAEDAADTEETPPAVTTETDCTNGIDDDADGNSDCFDADCSQACYVTEACDDGVDDDGDGAVDCKDLDCSEDATCLSQKANPDRPFNTNPLERQMMVEL